MSQWTQFEEDSNRLPEGTKRVAYDADTQVYTFRDRDGKLYRSSPGETYGQLILVSSGANLADRPHAFDSGHAHKRESAIDSNVSSFHDILPANRIASTRTSIDRKSSTQSTQPLLPSRTSADEERPSQFISAVRKTTLMQGVARNLRRSMTSIRRKPTTMDAEETNKLLSRHPSVSTARSGSPRT